VHALCGTRRHETSANLTGSDVWQIALALPLAQAISAQQAPATHTIFMNAVEYKGSTTTEKLMPPSASLWQASRAP